MDLVVVTVSYNTRDLLADCLQSVFAGLQRSGLAGEVGVVDNASADGSAEMVRERFADVRLIAHGENLGFAAGNNLALRPMGFGQVVKTTIFLADMNDFAAVTHVYAERVGAEPPARATVEVSRLPKDVRVEIDAIAVLDRYSAGR